MINHRKYFIIIESINFVRFFIKYRLEITTKVHTRICDYVIISELYEYWLFMYLHRRSDCTETKLGRNKTKTYDS